MIEESAGNRIGGQAVMRIDDSPFVAVLNSQPSIGWHQDFAFGRKRQSSGGSACLGHAVVLRDKPAAGLHKLKQAMRAAQPDIAFAVSNNAFPTLVRKAVELVEIHYSVFICTAQAFFAAKPYNAGMVHAYATSEFICKPADVVIPAEGAGLHQRESMRGGNINPVGAVGSQAACANDFHRLAQVDDLQTIAPAAGKRLARTDPQSAIG